MKNSKINVSKTGKSAVSMAVQSIPDVVRCARGDISGRQLAKNTAVRVGGAYGAAGGMNAGAVIGTMLCPGIGTIIGGLLGMLGGGKAASAVAKSTLDIFIDDDD